MTIVIVQDYLRQGGTESQSVFLARRFAAAGHRVSVLTFRPGGILAPDLEAAGVPHRALQPVDTGLNTFAPGLVRALRAEGAGIVLLMGRMANRFVTRIRNAVTGARVIATARSGRGFLKAHRKGFAAADSVVTNSRWAAEMVAMAGAPAERIKVIPNAFTRDWDDPDAVNERLRTRTEAGVAENACVFVDVAGFRPGKGQETLLRLFAALPREQPWQLWLVGDGPRRRRCEELARQLSVESRVRFWGHHKQPRPFYAGADCAVHASRYESMPNFLVEAQIAGLPVVAMRAGGVGETFVPGASGFLLEPGDLAGFADSVQLLLNDGQLRRRMGETGAANARELFDPEANIRAYLELFERLGGGPASA